MNTPIRKIAFSAVIAALYAGLTMLLAPISFGALQFRISEALCILPFFFPSSVWGLFLGCALANIISTLGPIDIIFGSLATLLAALGTMYIGKKGRTKLRCVLACLPPVVSNGIIIGAVISAVSAPADGFLAGMLLFGAEVALGELGVVLIIGLPVMLWGVKNGFFDRIKRKYDI